MVQIKATQVTYEALGRVQVTYTDNFDMDYIQATIGLIADTARVTDLKNVTVDKAIYTENNLEKIEKWHESVKYVEK